MPDEQHDEGHQLIAELLDISVDDVEQIGARLRAQLNGDVADQINTEEGHQNNKRKSQGKGSR